MISRPAAHYLGIIEAAEKMKCDGIFMPSHGRGEPSMRYRSLQRSMRANGAVGSRPLRNRL
jgi:hypothetical protein